MFYRVKGFVYDNFEKRRSRSRKRIMKQVELTPASMANPLLSVGNGLSRIIRKPTQEQIVLLVSVVALPIFGLLISGFATWANFGTLTLSVAVLGILSLGMAVVIIGRGLDLSQVAYMAAFTGIALQFAQLSYGLATSLLIGLGGDPNGSCQRISNAFVEIPALFTTLASGSLVFGLVRTFVLPGVIIYAPKDAPIFFWIGQGNIFGVPVPVIIFAILALFLQVFLIKTYRAQLGTTSRCTPVGHRRPRADHPAIRVFCIDRLHCGGCHGLELGLGEPSNH